MKVTIIAIGLASASLIVSLVALSKLGSAPMDESHAGAAEKPQLRRATGNDQQVVETRLAALEQKIGIEEPASQSNVGDRLTAIEASLAKLTSAFEGISLESASADRDELFRTENGYLKADEYYAAEKYAIAGEGYLAFLEANPDHPEAYDILKRARQAFVAAGYSDKAVWAQEQLLANLGVEKRAGDVLKLAQLQKDAGDFQNAIKNAAGAAELSTEPSERLWNRMYWAWYNQLQDGEVAGLTAYREVEREIDAAGKTDDKLGIKVRAKIEEIERANKSQTSAK